MGGVTEATRAASQYSPRSAAPCRLAVTAAFFIIENVWIFLPDLLNLKGPSHGGPFFCHQRFSNSGNLAMFAAILRASSLENIFDAVRRPDLACIPV
jgi:hypothetical protein